MRILLMLLLPALSFATAAVEYDAGSISTIELRRYAELRGTIYSDVLKTFHEGPDAGDKELAGEDLDAASSELLFNRVLSAKAHAQGFTAPASHLEDLVNEFHECVGMAAEESIGREIALDTPEEWAAAFERHGPHLNQPERRETAYIFRAFRATDTPREREEARNALEDIRADIQAGALTFAEAAKLHSEAASAPQGGRLGTVVPDSPYNPRIKQAIFAVPEVGLSEVLTLHNGFYLFHVSEIRPAVVYTKDQVSSNTDLQNTLLDRERQAAIAEARQEALKAHPGLTPRGALGKARLAAGFSSPACELTRRLQEEQITAHLFFFSNLPEEEFVPDEEQMREYYRNNPQEMYGEGLWRLTRYTVVPGEDDKLGIWNLQQAADLATEVRVALTEGETPDDVLARYEPRGLRSESHEGWVHGTDHAAADQELLSLKVGAYSSVHRAAGGAFFFRLLERRERPVQSFEESISYIRNVMTHQAQYEAKKKEAARLMKEHNAVEHWRNPPKE